MSKRKNAGKGFGMMFHGLFGSKTDAKKKERKTKGAFIKRTSTPKGTRYLVMSPRTNPIKRKKKTPKPNPHELLVMGANPSPVHKEQEIVVPPGSTITIRMNPMNPDHFTSAHARAKGLKKQPPGLIQTKRQRRVAGMVRIARRHKYDWIPSSGGIAPGQNPGDDQYMYAAVAELYPGKTLGQLSTKELSQVAQRAAALKHGQLRRNSSAAAIREDFTGAPVERVTIKHESHMAPGDYAKLGKLLTLYVKPLAGGQVLEIRAKGGVQIVSDERARAEEGELGPIWFVDGNQDVTESLARFGARSRSDGLLELGEARRIDYEQRKEHARDPDKDQWKHYFGEETNVRPTVLFDRATKRLLLEGGQYEIRTEGIVN